MNDVKRIRVLIVDDEESFSAPLAQWLESEHGYVVDTACNGQEGLGFVREAQGGYDVVLVDQVLRPGPDGIKIMKTMKEEYPALQAVILTGWGDTDSGIRAMREGAFRYLAKPFDHDELALLIRSMAEFRGLIQVSQAVNSTLNLDQVLNAIYEQTNRLINIAAFYIALYDEAREELHFEFVFDEGQRIDKFTRKLSEGEGLTGWIVKNRKPLLFNDLPEEEEDKLPVPSFTLGEPAKSWLGLPLIAKDRVIGVISIQSYEPYAFNQNHQRLLTAIANQAAIAIENAQLHQQAKARSRQLEALDQIALDVTARLEINELLSATIRRATELVQASGGGIYLLTETGEQFRLEAVWGLPDLLEGTLINKDQGVIGQVLKTRWPVFVPNYGQWPGRLQMLDEFNLTAVAGAPIMSGDQFLGAIAVHDTKQGGEFSSDECDVLLRFGRHAAVAIENARLFAETSRQLEELNRLYEGSQVVVSPLSLDAVLARIIDLAGKVAGSNHTGVVLVGEDGRLVTSVESHEVGTPLHIRARPDGITRKVIATRKPVAIDEVCDDSKTHNPVIVKQRFESYAGVPIVSGGKVLGVLFVHSFHPRAFSKRITILTLFASQAAIAIQNAQLHTETERRLKQLELLEEVKQAVDSVFDLQQVLSLTLRRGLEMVRAEAGSIMLVDNKTHLLKIHAWFGSGWTEEKKQLTFKVGTGIAGWVVEHKVACRCPDVQKDSRFVKPAFDPSIRSLLAVPILSHGRAIGVLNADSSEVDFFSTEDERLLNTLAGQVAIAIEKAKLLGALQEIGLAIVQAQALDRVLQLVIEKSFELIGFDNGWLSLINEQGKLEVKAATKPIDDSVKIDLEVDERSIMGWVAKTGQPLNVPDVSVDPRYRKFYADTRSELAIPLKIQNRVVGVLNAESTKENVFDEYDMHMLTTLANQAAVAVENALLLGHLKEARERLSSMVASSFDGIIDLDTEGRVTGFNSRAEAITGYKAEEMLGKHVSEMYYDPEEPRRIGKLLWSSPEGRLHDYHTYVRGKPLGDTDDRRGEKIPVHLSATWLLDSQGKWIGSVGFFRDLRAIRETETHRKLLLEASSSVAQAQSLREGLQTLAEQMVKSGMGTLCLVLLLADDGKSLVVQAAYPVPRSQRLVWDPGLGKVCPVFRRPELAELLGKDVPIVFRWGKQPGDFVLQHIAEQVKLEGALNSALAIPLHSRARHLGVCVLCEMREWKRNSFTDREVELGRSLATHAAILIDRMQLHEETMRRLHVLSKLYEVLSALRTNPDRDYNLDLITSTLMDLFGADTCTVGLFNPELTRLKFVVGQGLEKLPDYSTRVLPPDLLSHVCTNPEPIVIPYLGDRPGLQKILVRPDLRSFLIMPLLGRERPLGVITVGSISEIQLSSERRNMLKALSGQAILAIEETEKRAQQLDSLLKISGTILSPLDLQTVLKEIVENIVNGLGVEIAILYAYDEEKKNKFGVPVIAGALYHEEKMRASPSKDSVVYKMLDQQEPRIAVEVEQDELLAGDFTRREKVRSSAIFPLRVGTKPVGMMFVNYRKSHYFTPSEVDTFQVFANQAAVAIEYARLYRSVTERLETANAMAWIGTASSLWAHEVQQKTFSIWTDTASLRDYVTENKVQRILTRIEAEVASLGDVIPRLPSSDVEEVVELGKVLADVCEKRERELQEHHISVKSNLAELPPVWANHQWLVEAFDGLTKNAIRAMPDSGTLTFTGELGGDNVFIEAIDTGKGFPEHVRCQIYKGRVTGTDAEGMGIGLLLVKTIFNRYGGDIDLPHLDERGNVFPIKLPIAKQNSEG